jgi:hypothetical protein
MSDRSNTFNDLESYLEQYRKQWTEATKNFEKLSEEQTREILNNCVYQIPSIEQKFLMETSLKRCTNKPV